MIKTERLFLRKINEEDLDLIFDINNDPLCIRFNGWDSMSQEQCNAEIDKWVNKYKDQPYTGVFCVEHLISGEKIGMAYIIEYKLPMQYEIGFRLRSSQWNNGYAKEITRGFFQYAKDLLNAQEIVAEVYTANTRSVNIFEKLGFSSVVHPAGPDGLLFSMQVK